MKSKQVKLVIIDGCGDELLDAVLATVNYNSSGIGEVLVHTDDLSQVRHPSREWRMVEKIQDYLNDPKRNDAGPVSIPYEGLVLLRR